jgi:hypothetical protein
MAMFWQESRLKNVAFTRKTIKNVPFPTPIPATTHPYNDDAAMNMIVLIITL